MYLLALAIATLAAAADSSVTSTPAVTASPAPTPAAYVVPGPEDFAPVCKPPEWFNNNSDYPHTPATCVTAVVLEMDHIAIECALSGGDPEHCLDLYAHAVAVGEACIVKAIENG